MIMEERIRKEANVVLERIEKDDGLEANEKKLLKKTLSNVAEFKIIKNHQVNEKMIGFFKRHFYVFSYIIFQIKTFNEKQNLPKAIAIFGFYLIKISKIVV